MTRNHLGRTRREYLVGAGGALTAGIAGCIGAGSENEINVAYMPIFPDLQYFVMEAEGYFSDIDAEIAGHEFTDGPAIIQAYGGGEIDIAMFGIVPSMIVIDRGLPAKVTAANIKEPMAILAHEDFQRLWARGGPEAFAQWEADHGRPFRFGTFPSGSVPDVLLRYWLTDIVGVDPNSVTDIIEIDGANAVFQAITNGEIDGTSIMEPVPTRVEDADIPIRTLKTAGEIMPGQPAAVTLMSDSIRESPIATQFIVQHARATEFINANPDRTARIVESGIGMPVEQASRALAGPLSNFVTEPRSIENGTDIFARFAHENGQIDRQLSTEEIFDFSVYDER